MAGPVTLSQLSNVNGSLIVRDLRKVFYETGKERPLEYPMVLNIDTMDWNPQKDFQVAGIGTQPDKPEGSRFVLDAHKLGGAKEYTATPKGLAIEFTFESWRDELYGVLKEVVKEQSRATRQRQEVDGWSIFNDAFDTTVNGFTAGESLCSTTHVGLDGVTRANRPAVDIGASVTYFQNAITRFETLTDERGNPRLLAPVMAVGTPTNKFTIREILGSSGRPFTADNELNALIHEDLSWMISHYITTQTYIFLVASKENHDLQFLWRDRPIFDSFDDPWTKSAVFTAYQRFTQGWGAWRGIDGSTG